MIRLLPNKKRSFLEKLRFFVYSDNMRGLLGKSSKFMIRPRLRP